MKKHDKLKEAAVRAIDELHGDTSVSTSETLHALEELGEKIEELCAFLVEDIQEEFEGS